MVDVEFTADVFVCMVRITNPRYDPRGCVYIGFQTHMQMTLICGKAPVENAVPMQTVLDAKAVKEIFWLGVPWGYLHPTQAVLPLFSVLLRTIIVIQVPY